jgi:hypothetical protein
LNLRVNSASSSSPNTSNSLPGKEIKEDKEYVLEDGLAFVITPEPPTRARLWEQVGLSIRAVTPRSTSADLA